MYNELAHLLAQVQIKANNIYIPLRYFNGDLLLLTFYSYSDAYLVNFRIF